MTDTEKLSAMNSQWKPNRGKVRAIAGKGGAGSARRVRVRWSSAAQPRQQQDGERGPGSSGDRWGLLADWSGLGTGAVVWGPFFVVSGLWKRNLCCENDKLIWFPQNPFVSTSQNVGVKTLLQNIRVFSLLAVDFLIMFCSSFRSGLWTSRGLT